ncbi:pseudouridine synthase [Bdellovibrio bacteriovorus]|uniref:pseudouridine synthase n=1 Tax=Bdellovibrio TaxID=958 RepID=UPI0035A8DD97
MRILYQDEYFFAIDKPAGYFVHPPELSPYPVPKEKICLYHLRKQMNQDVFPVHRLDAPTSGVLLWTTSREATRELSRLFMERKLQKTYHAVVRGHVEEEGSIDIPLEVLGEEGLLESKTIYKRLGAIELPFPVGKKYPTARYSLVEVQPVTGRWHQIRRHFDRVAHPLLGDIDHGDSHHNRFFRDHLEIKGLCLKAVSVELQHPWSGENLKIEAPACEKWEKIYSLFAKNQ